MDKPKRSKTVPIDNATHMRLKEISAKTGLKIGAMVNQAIAAWVKLRRTTGRTV